ncbi:MAG: hypothetical protein Q7T33_08360 [Dehalococcoidia bacterium]|nr:hypothetical protein [Dehalococcoidia bacterium]
MLANYAWDERDFLLETQVQGGNPWVCDHALLNLAIWWVKMTGPRTADFAADVAIVFTSLERDLRRGVNPA